DIKSEEEKRREIEEQMTALTAPATPLTVLAGVGPKTIEKLEEAGITSLEKLASMTPEQLLEIPGVGEKMVDKIYQAVNRFYEGGEGTAAPTEEAEVSGEGEPSETAEAAEIADEGTAQGADRDAPEAAAETSDESASPEQSEANSEEAVAENSESADKSGETEREKS